MLVCPIDINVFMTLYNIYDGAFFESRQQLLSAI